MSVATWTFEVDWNGDGDFADTGETVTSDVRADRLRISRGRDHPRALAPTTAASAEWVLDNQSADYYPDNGGGVGAQTGVECHIEANFSSTDYNLFWGRIDDLQIFPHSSEQTAPISALGSLADFRGVQLTTTVHQAKSTGTLIDTILDEVGWPAGARSLDTGKTIIPWWWAEGADALTAILELVNCEGPGARVDVAPDGTFIFHDRHYRLLTTASNTSQATFRDTGSEPLFTGLSYEQGWRNIVNDVSIDINNYAEGAVETIWYYGNMVLGPSQTRTLWVSANDPFVNAETPIAGDGYTIESGSLSSLTMARTSGRSAKLTITAGAGGCFLSGLYVKGRFVTGTPLKITDSDATSQGKYGVRSLPLSLPWISEAQAVDYADEILTRYKDPNPTVAITVYNANDTRYVQQLARDLDDRITIVETNSSVNDDFWIEHITHDVTAGGKVHATTFTCEKVAGTSTVGTGLVLDDATDGKLDTGTLAF